MLSWQRPQTSPTCSKSKEVGLHHLSLRKLYDVCTVTQVSNYALLRTCPLSSHTPSLMHIHASALPLIDNPIASVRVIADGQSKHTDTLSSHAHHRFTSAWTMLAASHVSTSMKTSRISLLVCEKFFFFGTLSYLPLLSDISLKASLLISQEAECFGRSSCILCDPRVWCIVGS